MFEIAWSKLMLIGVVALIVIGPKDLPAVLRTLGETIAKLRRMADEFRGQFNEAMREAELDGLKKDITDLGDTVRTATATDFNPINTIREEIKGAVEAKQASAQASSQAAETLQPLTDAESRTLEIKMMEERLEQLKAEQQLSSLPLPETPPTPDFSAPAPSAQPANVEALPDPAKPAAKAAEKGAA